VRTLELEARHGPLRAADCAVQLPTEAAVCGGEARVSVRATAVGGGERALTAADHLAMVRCFAC
jgi:hypothetical protein